MKAAKSRYCHAPRSECGNFLLQALLALALIISFMPLITRRISDFSHDSEMSATVSQINSATSAAGIFIRTNSATLPYGVTNLTGLHFADALEPYGLPIGFIQTTPLNQNISMVISKTEDDVFAAIVISGGSTTRLSRAELATRLGFWAATPSDGNKIENATGGWDLDLSAFGLKPTDSSIYIRIPMNEDFSELVKKRNKKPEDYPFFTDLDLGGFDMTDVGAAVVHGGQFKTMTGDSLTLSGIEDGRKIRNNIKTAVLGHAVFRADARGAALSVIRGTLSADTATVKTISAFGDAGAIKADAVSVKTFDMTAGHTGFTGPIQWDIHGNMVLQNVTLDVQQLELASSINAARGQEVFINDNGLDYSVKSGIETGTIHATYITMRDQISSSLAAGGDGPVVLDLRPAGTSVMPDVLLDGIDNGAMSIISTPSDGSGKMTDCRSTINNIGGKVRDSVTYNQRSLAQNIVCQYVLWQRLEKRIDIKQCMLDGKTNCGG